MTGDVHDGDFVADELGENRKPNGRNVVKDRFGKVICGPFTSVMDAECHCRSQSQLDDDHMRQWNFDQDT